MTTVVFLGTPQVAAEVLKDLVGASQLSGANFKVSAVVTRAPVQKADGSGTHGPSPVHKTALDLGMARSQILTPASPKQEDFLQAMRRLGCDLCVTAAYGGMLPQAFLDIPKQGTVNIHPSLLPLYRGPAPVQRTLERGDAETGVTLLYTVLACDAGPIVEQSRMALQGDEQAPELTASLFKLGSQMLIRNLPGLLSGSSRKAAVPQDSLLATHAPKVAREEGQLDPSQPAQALHNKVRAMAGWPGTFLELEVVSEKERDNGKRRLIQVPVSKTRVLREGDLPENLFHSLTTKWSKTRVHFVKGRHRHVLVPCGGADNTSYLDVLEIKSSPTVADFMHRLGKNNRLHLPGTHHTN